MLKVSDTFTFLLLSPVVWVTYKRSEKRKFEWIKLIICRKWVQIKQQNVSFARTPIREFGGWRTMWFLASLVGRGSSAATPTPARFSSATASVFFNEHFPGWNDKLRRGLLQHTRGTYYLFKFCIHSTHPPCELMSSFVGVVLFNSTLPQMNPKAESEFIGCSSSYGLFECFHFNPFS